MEAKKGPRILTYITMSKDMVANRDQDIMKLRVSTSEMSVHREMKNSKERNGYT